MKSIGIFEAKTKLSEICCQVMECHEPVIITRRGKPMVRIDPIDDDSGDSEIWKRSDEFRKKNKISEEIALPERKVEKIKKIF